MFPIILSPYHPIILSPYLPISLSPYLPISLSPYHPISLLLSSCSHLQEVLFPNVSKKIKRKIFPVIRIGPLQGMKLFPSTYIRQVCINSIPKINPMSIILSSRQHHLSVRHISRINIYSPLSLNSILLLNLIGKIFDIRETLDRYHLTKTYKFFLKICTHLLCIIVCIIKQE
jgi:hypothetical protein